MSVEPYRINSVNGRANCYYIKETGEEKITLVHLLLFLARTHSAARGFHLFIAVVVVLWPKSHHTNNNMILIFKPRAHLDLY